MLESRYKYEDTIRKTASKTDNPNCYGRIFILWISDRKCYTGYVVSTIMRFCCKEDGIRCTGCCCAKIGCRGSPEAGDLVILIGGRTGRDGIGAAVGSSRAY